MDSELLINEVAKYQALYDVESPEYKNRYKKDAAWAEVASKLNTEVSSCQKRWRTIRDTYAKEIKEEELATRSGAGARRKKPWHLMSYLTFLKKSMSPRPSISTFRCLSSSSPTTVSPSPPTVTSSPIVNQNTPSPSSFTMFSNFSNSAPLTTSSHATVFSQPSFSMSSPLSPCSDLDLSQGSFQSFSQTPVKAISFSDHSYSTNGPSSSKQSVTPPAPTSSNAIKKTTTKRQKLDTLDREHKDLLKLLEPKESVDPKAAYTSSELFCLSMASNLDRLEPANREKTKLRLQQVLFEAEFGTL